MKLSRRPPEPDEVEEIEPDPAPASGKGRPTPKRRDVVGVRGPVVAPKTRKEAYARQRSQARAARQVSRRTRASGSGASGTASASMTPAERRAALRSGEMLAKRDQGATRKLARDYVDSRRMASNYLLLLLPLLLLGAVIPGIAFVTPLLMVLFIAEWWFTGRRLRAMSMERFGSADGGNMSIGFYAGSRAYLPRRWRLPAPQVGRGDQI